MNISGGTFNITTTGKGMWDTDDLETKAACCLSADGNMNISGGAMTLKSTGSGGKGMKCDNMLTITDGTINVTTTGALYYNNGTTENTNYTGNTDQVSSQYYSSPKGIKAGTKTEAGVRDVPISDKLKPYLEEALKKYKKNKQKLLFYDCVSKRVITTTQVNSYYKRVCSSVGIESSGQHALRHTFATRCIEAGIPAVVLKTWLGHKDIHMTLDTYTDVFQAMDNDAISKYDEHLNSM